MSTEVASAYVSLGARIAGLEAGLAKANTSVERFSRNADRSSARASSALASIGRGARMGALAVGVGLGYAAKVAADFEKQLSTLKVVTGANAAQMGRLRTQALALGQSTIFSTREVAAAQVELGKAGMTVQQILGGGLKASLSLAAAGNLDLAQAAKISATSMNNFGLKAKSARSIADQLATAANTTTGEVADFGAAIENVGAVSRTAGLGFKDTNVALMALAKSGTLGAEAGTNFRSMLTNIATPSAKAAGLMKRLNIDFYDANGRFKDMASVSAMLRDRLGRLTMEQRQHDAAIIAGSYGQKALLALYQAGPERLKLYEQQLSRTGTAARTAAGMQDNLRGKWEQFTGMIETGAIRLGTAMIPALTAATVSLTDFGQGLANSEGFQTFASGVGAALASSFTLIGSAAQSAAGPVATLGTALKFFASNPIGPAVLGGAAGIYAGVKAVQALSGAMSILNKVTKASPWAIALTGAAALTGIIVGLNSALGSGASAEERLASATKTAAAAHRDAAAAAAAQKQAMDALKGANLDVKDASLNLRDAQAAQKQAMADAGPVAQRTAAQQAAVERANIAAARAGIQYRDAVRAQSTAQKGAADASQKSADAVRNDIFQRKQQLDAAQKAYASAQAGARVMGNQSASAAALRSAQARLTETQKAYVQALATAPGRLTAQANAARQAAANVQGHGAAADAARAKLLGEARSLDVSAAAARTQAAAMARAGGAMAGAGGQASGAAGNVSALAAAINSLPSVKRVSVLVSVSGQGALAGVTHVGSFGTPSKKARGGQVRGRAGKDNNPHLLSRGEWVLTEQAAGRLGGPDAMRAALGGRAAPSNPAPAARPTTSPLTEKQRKDRDEARRKAEEAKRKARDRKYSRVVERPSNKFALGQAKRDVNLARAERTSGIGDDIRAIDAQTAANSRRVTQITKILKKNSKFLTKQEKAQLEAEKAQLIRDSTANRAQKVDLRSNQAQKIADGKRRNIDLMTARAALTGGTEDDRAALQALQADATARLAAARASGDKDAELQALQDMATAASGLKQWLSDQAAAQMQAQDAQVALAKLTTGTDDDRAALQAAKDDAVRRLDEAKAAGDNAAIINLVERILGLTSAIDGLTDSVDQNTATQQQFGGGTSFQYRGQTYLSSSDRLVGMEVGI